MKAGSACLDENLLVDIAQGRVKADAWASAEHHLATCDECSETLAALATVVNPTVPTAVSAQAIGAPLAPGTILNDTYRLLRLIDRGGMGDVYEAAHLRLEGRRAVKVLNGDRSETTQTAPRFMREAGIASALRHPNIVQVLDFSVTSDGQPFLVMEFLEGQHFGDLIETQAPMSLTRVLELIAPVAAALEVMHRRGIVHRDLKPQNIMLVSDPETGSQVVKVLDFGLAKRAARPGSDSLELSKGRVLLGTPMYMAPEQAAGDLDAVGPAADQFALAALVYEMLTKQQAFFAETTTQILHRVISVDPAPLRSLVPSVPAHAERAVLRSLSKDPRLRFPTVSDLVSGMSASGALAAGVVSSEGTRRVRPGLKLRRAVMGVLVTATLSLLALLGVAWKRNRPEQRRQETTRVTAAVTVAPPDFAPDGASVETIAIERPTAPSQATVSLTATLPRPHGVPRRLKASNPTDVAPLRAPPDLTEPSANHPADVSDPGSEGPIDLFPRLERPTR